ncbi:SLC13 family permease [Salidesulfovibrio onnuriiensis]|uniref:SLC13 family permease n=1 Tax=Salidesulfovibrio onnuriiensis TaxID=2583823 RepID=UPI0011CCB9E8|nr:SLC13 family permease [Salidesulfovibrio onnuriiensis]
MTQILDGLLERLPLILVFVSGYVVYRLMAVTRITDTFVIWALRRSHGRPGRLILYIIGASAALSAFIPNAITVLTLLPILKLLDKDFREQGVRGMTTPLMVAAIYGAGIGGMGSMIGTPANAILLVALDFLNIPGREQITFFNWFLWSVPLVVMFIGLAWLVAGVVGLPRGARGVELRLSCQDGSCEVTPRQRFGCRLFVVFLAYWVFEAVARAVSPAFAALSPLTSTAFVLVFLLLVFVKPAPGGQKETGPLLRPGHLVSGVPRRGLVFVLLLMAVFGTARWFGLDQAASAWVGRHLSVTMPHLLVFFLTVLAVIFLTEVLSNTVVVAGFFTIVHLTAQAHGMDSLPLMIAVSVASTCAFMTPVATPSNAFAFGEMRGASLRIMLLLGALLNLLGALLMTGWLSWVLPLVY